MDENLKAINEIAEMVKGFKEKLGEKADNDKINEVNNDIKELKSSLNSLTEIEIDKAIKAINEKNESLYNQILELRDDVKDANSTKNKTKEVLTEKEVEDFIKGFYDIESRRKDYSKAPRLTVKAPETFGYPQTFVNGSQVDAFTGREVDPMLYEPKRKRNLILDTFAIPSISVPTLYYLEKEVIGDTNPTSGDPGAAGWIASGAAKPKRSFRLKTGKVEAKKVAIFATIEDKLLRDVASMRNWILDDLTDEMREAINDGLLNNNPAVDANAPLGLKTNAVQYSVTPAFEDAIDDPNEIDAMIAVLAFMVENKETPGSLHVSSDIFYRIHNLKATDGKYLNNNLIYVNNLGQLFIAGTQVFAEDSEDVPSTHILAISNDNPFKIRAYGGMTLEPGLNGENFREDKTSFRGYQEFLSYLPENRENGVVYDTFANIYAAILKPAT